MTHKKVLYKSTENKILTGVASGIADYLDTDYIVIRALFVLLAFASGVGIIIYLVLSILLPRDNEVIEQEDKDFYYYFNEKDKNKKKYIDFIYKSIFNINILAILIIILGILALQFNFIPWNIIPETVRYSALVLAISFAFLLKSIHK